LYAYKFNIVKVEDDNNLYILFSINIVRYHFQTNIVTEFISNLKAISTVSKIVSKTNLNNKRTCQLDDKYIISTQLLNNNDNNILLTACVSLNIK